MFPPPKGVASDDSLSVRREQTTRNNAHKLPSLFKPRLIPHAGMEEDQTVRPRAGEGYCGRRRHGQKKARPPPR